MDAAPGSKVRILDHNLEVLESVYEVEAYVTAQIVRLTNMESGHAIRIHKSRVCEVVNGSSNKENRMAEDVAVTEEVTEVEPNVSVAETPKPRKSKTSTKVDWSQYPGERWDKEVEFDCATYKACAHVVIAEDGKTYQTFNTYNGSLGKKGKGGKTFDLKESLEKYKAKLARKGYVKAED